MMPVMVGTLITQEISHWCDTSLSFISVLLKNSALIFRRRQWHPTPVLLPGKFHGWRSLVGYSPWDCEESDMTEQVHFDFSLWCIGEGNGNPLQCSCLENPRDRRAWQAAVSGVAQSRTQLKWLCSSSSPHFPINTFFLCCECILMFFYETHFIALYYLLPNYFLKYMSSAFSFTNEFVWGSALCIHLNFSLLFLFISPQIKCK